MMKSKWMEAISELEKKDLKHVIGIGPFKGDISEVEDINLLLDNLPEIGFLGEVEKSPGDKLPGQDYHGVVSAIHIYKKEVSKDAD